MTPFCIVNIIKLSTESELLPSSYYGDISNCKQLKELMGSLDECMHGQVCVQVPFLTQWFAIILSATNINKIGQNNPFLLIYTIKVSS